MNWETLAATALGGLLAAGGTVVVDHFRWRRDHGARERSACRELYGRYLAALALTTHQLYDLQRSGSLPPAERARLAGEALTASGAYELRYQMLVSAPAALETPVEQAFGCLRTLRDHLSGPTACTDSEWDSSIAEIRAAISGLKRAMKTSLAE